MLVACAIFGINQPWGDSDAPMVDKDHLPQNNSPALAIGAVKRRLLPRCHARRVRPHHFAFLRSSSAAAQGVQAHAAADLTSTKHLIIV